MSAPRSPDVTWHAGALTRERRWQALGHAGATVWFTGLPSSGRVGFSTAVLLGGRTPSGGAATGEYERHDERHD